MSWKKILACLDLVSDEHALIARAAALARSNDARLTWVHVLDGRAPEAQRAALEEQARARIAELTGATAEGIDTAVCLRYGHPVAEILAEAEGHELVLTGADHRRGLSEMLFGGTTTALLRACPQPVMVVHAAQPQPAHVVLAAVALINDPDDDHDPLDERILRLGVEQAALAGGKLHVAHVVESWIPFAGIDDELKAQSELLVRQKRRGLDKLLERAGVELPTEQVHSLEGDPGMQIIELCQQLDVELLVMGTVARTGITGLIVGNTAEKMMRRVGCSLLALKPDQFHVPRA